MKCPKCQQRKLIKLDEPEMSNGVLCDVYVCTKCVLSYYLAKDRKERGK